jgi:hypothetical protein
MPGLSRTRLKTVINGLFVSKRLVEIARQGSQTGSNILKGETESHYLRSADTTEFNPSGFSVTEEATKHLEVSGQKKQTSNKT